MPGFTQTPRSRGLISGLFVFLLGGWGGLGPFVAPYLRYGFTPDRAWAVTSGRVYLSAIPGAVALLAGLVIMVSRSRALGVIAALIAMLAGAWFVGGAGVLSLLAGRAGSPITAGAPIQAGQAGLTLAEFGLFTGVGMLMVLFAGVAAGRLSITALRDFVVAGEEYEYAGETAAQGYQAGPAPLVLPAVADPFAVTGEITTAEPS